MPGRRRDDLAPDLLSPRYLNGRETRLYWLSVVLCVVWASQFLFWTPDDDPADAAAAYYASHLPAAGPVGSGVWSRPPEVHTANGTYRFLYTRTSDGAPFTWDPCQPVPLVVNPDSGPADAVGLVREAAAEISAASGLDVVVVGTTDERPGTGRPLSLARYPGAWAPVLVAWSDVGESPGLHGALGYALPRGATVAGTGRFVTGQVVLDAAWFTGDVATDLAIDAEDQGSVVLHELGHTVGLQHVDDQDEVMYPGAWASELGPGDRAGLAALGAGRCAGE